MTPDPAGHWLLSLKLCSNPSRKLQYLNLDTSSTCEKDIVVATIDSESPNINYTIELQYILVAFALQACDQIFHILGKRKLPFQSY